MHFYFQAAESFRITIGNDQFKKRVDDSVEDRLDPSLSHRLGPPVARGSEETNLYGRESDNHFRLEDPSYRRTADQDKYPIHNTGGSDYSDRYRDDRHTDRGPESRSYSSSGSGSSLFPAGARKGDLVKEAPLYPRLSSTSSPSTSSSASRPLKSILKKKSEPTENATPPERKITPGLAGISNYMDDIDDEEKFLYGEDDRERGNKRDSFRESSKYQAGTTMPSTASSIRSAAQSWQPAQPTTETQSNTVPGLMSKFNSAQREFKEHTVQPGGGSYAGSSFSNQSQHPQPQASTPVGGDLWNLLAKSVQTAQQQTQLADSLQNLGMQGQSATSVGQQSMLPGQHQPILTGQPAAQYQANPQSSVQNEAKPQTETGYDPTIENILKSIGFDFDMSKRMQEKAKQTQEQSLKPEDPQFGINQTASFLEGGLSHDEMKTKLFEKGHAGVDSLIQEAKQNVYPHDHRDSDRDMDDRGRDVLSANDNQARRSIDMRDERDHRQNRERDLRNDRNSRDSQILGLRESRDRDSIGSRDRDSITDRGRDRDARDRESIGSREQDTRNYRDFGERQTSDYQSPRFSPRRSPRTGLSAFERELSPVSAEGSPPIKIDLSPMAIRRKSRLERNRSPGWDKNLAESERTRRSSDGREKIRSRSPSWGRIVITAGRRSSRSPVRNRSPSPRKIHISPPKLRSSSPRRRSLSPRRRSPRRSRSPRRRSRSPRRSVSPRKRRRSISPRNRSLSPRNRRGISPRNRSISPRRRSISPRGRRIPSPKGRRLSRSPRRSPRQRRSPSPRGRKRSFSPVRNRSRSRDRKIRRSRSKDRGRRISGRSLDRRSSSRSPKRRRSLSSSLSVSSISDDPDSKTYFTAPLHGPPRPIPGQFYDHFPPGPPPGPPPFGPPPTVYAPPYNVPPPPYSIPPPVGAPPFVPQPQYMPPQAGPPPPDGQPQPPGTEFEMPLALPGRIYPATLTEVSQEKVEYPRPEDDRSRRSGSSDRESRDSRRSRDRRKERRSTDRDRRDKRSKERVDKKGGRSSERSDWKSRRSAERADRKSRRSVEKVDKKGRRSSERSTSSKKTGLPPNAENFEIKASVTGHDRVVIIGGKDRPKSPGAKEKPKSPVEKETRQVNVDDKKWSAAVEKEKLLKERDKLNKENELRHSKIKTLVTELENLKKQQTELTKSDGGRIDDASNQILIENNKLQEEIQEEVEKLQKEQKQTNENIEDLLSKELKLVATTDTPAKKEEVIVKDEKKTAPKKQLEAIPSIKPKEQVSSMLFK